MCRTVGGSAGACRTAVGWVDHCRASVALRIYHRISESALSYDRNTRLFEMMKLIVGEFVPFVDSCHAYAADAYAADAYAAMHTHSTAQSSRCIRSRQGEAWAEHSQWIALWCAIDQAHQCGGIASARGWTGGRRESPRTVQPTCCRSMPACLKRERSASICASRAGQLHCRANSSRSSRTGTSACAERKQSQLGARPQSRTRHGIPHGCRRVAAASHRAA